MNISTEGHVRRSIPWLRFLLAVSYSAVLVLAVMQERSATQVLHAAESWEAENKHATAAIAYRTVVTKYPLSYASVDAEFGAVRNEPALKAMLTSGPPRESRLERWCRRGLRIEGGGRLSILAPALACVLFLAVFITRIRRRTLLGLSSLVLAGVCAAGVYGQLASHGLVAEAMLPLLESPHVTHLAGVGCLVVAALTTLTRTAPRTPTESRPKAVQ